MSDPFDGLSTFERCECQRLGDLAVVRVPFLLIFMSILSSLGTNAALNIIPLFWRWWRNRKMLAKETAQKNLHGDLMKFDKDLKTFYCGKTYTCIHNPFFQKTCTQYQPCDACLEAQSPSADGTWFFSFRLQPLTRLKRFAIHFAWRLGMIDEEYATQHLAIMPVQFFDFTVQKELEAICKNIKDMSKFATPEHESDFYDFANVIGCGNSLYHPVDPFDVTTTTPGKTTTTTDVDTDPDTDAGEAILLSAKTPTITQVAALPATQLERQHKKFNFDAGEYIENMRSRDSEDDSKCLFYDFYYGRAPAAYFAAERFRHNDRGKAHYDFYAQKTQSIAPHIEARADRTQAWISKQHADGTWLSKYLQPDSWLSRLMWFGMSKKDTGMPVPEDYLLYSAKMSPAIKLTAKKKIRELRIEKMIMFHEYDAVSHASSTWQTMKAVLLVPNLTLAAFKSVLAVFQLVDIAIESEDQTYLQIYLTFFNSGALVDLAMLLLQIFAVAGKNGFGLIWWGVGTPIASRFGDLFEYESATDKDWVFKNRLTAGQVRLGNLGVRVHKCYTPGLVWDGTAARKQWQKSDSDQNEFVFAQTFTFAGKHFKWFLGFQFLAILPGLLTLVLPALVVWFPILFIGCSVSIFMLLILRLFDRWQHKKSVDMTHVCEQFEVTEDDVFNCKRHHLERVLSQSGRATSLSRREAIKIVNKNRPTKCSEATDSVLLVFRLIAYIILISSVLFFASFSCNLFSSWAWNEEGSWWQVVENEFEERSLSCWTCVQRAALQDILAQVSLWI